MEYTNINAITSILVNFGIICMYLERFGRIMPFINGSCIKAAYLFLGFPRFMFAQENHLCEHFSGYRLLDFKEQERLLLLSDRS